MSITSSTPIIPGPGGRRVLSELQTVEITPTRRKIVQGPQVVLTPSDINNDETERNKRRRNAAMQQRMSQIPAGSPAGSEMGSTDSPSLKNLHNMNKQEVLANLNLCNKMYAENKITKHNIWNVHVIEYMRRYLGMQAASGNVNVLQFASSTLDVSAKVYGMRVDDVYDKGKKLASALVRLCAGGDTSARDSFTEEGNDPEAAVGDNAAQKKTKAKKQKRKVPKATLVKENAQLVGSFPHIEIGFFQTQANIKSSMVENLFTLRLPLAKSATMIKLLTEDCSWRLTNDVDLLLTKPEVQKKFPVTLPSETVPELCPELKIIVVDEWDPDLEQVRTMERTMEDVLLDKEGIPVPELDASIHNEIENFDAVYNDSDGDEVDNQIVAEAMAGNNEVAFVVNFDPDNTNALSVNEYSYMKTTVNANREMSQIWAGPSHWKLKQLKRSAATFTGSQVESQINKRQKRVKRPVEDVNFAKEVPAYSSKTCRSRKSPSCEKHKMMVPLAKLDMMSCEQLLQKHAAMVGYRPRNSDKAVPNCRPGDLPAGAGEDHDNQDACALDTDCGALHMGDDGGDDLEPYDHNNLNNSQYCTQNAVTEDGGEQICDNFLENNLVDKPDMVTQSYLPYQALAKRIDIKKLKGAIWKCLTNGDHTQNGVQAQVIGTVSFRKIYKDVPEYFSEPTRSELSCHLTFVALLHLANEKNLHLTNTEELKDIFVSQG